MHKKEHKVSPRFNCLKLVYTLLDLKLHQTNKIGGHCERKKIALELWNFIFVALGDTNDGRNIASTSALKFQGFQEKILEHYTWCLKTWNAWRDRNGSTFEE